MENLAIFEFYQMFAVLLSNLFAPLTILIILTLMCCKQTVHRSIWLSTALMFVGAICTFFEAPESSVKIITLLIIGAAAGAVHLYKRDKYALAD